MSNQKKVAFICFLAVCTLVVISIPSFIGVHNRDQSLRNLAAAQQDVCKMVFDETWKIINQQAQVANEYKEAFREIFPELMEGRYGNERGGSLMSWISEHNPEFDASLYKTVQASIEAQRHKFTEAQKMLRDVKLQHDNLRTQFPSMLFMWWKPELKVTIITSSKTEKVYEEGKEDNVNVFQEK